LKKLLFIFVLLLTGCNRPGEDEFVEFGSEFYQQMFVDGEQSQEVIKLHEQLSKYDNFEQHELYISLEKMYDSLENDPVMAAAYQVEVMNILNK
jgi:hypothetical protein